MEKVINFSSKTNIGPLKNVIGKNNMGYYSEEEATREVTPQNKEEAKANGKFSNIKLRGGYETEDSDDNLTPAQKTAQTDTKGGKGLSGFFVYKGSPSANQHKGDEDAAECEDFTPKEGKEHTTFSGQAQEEQKTAVSSTESKQANNLYDNEIKLQEMKLLKEQRKKQKKIESLKEASAADFKEDGKKTANQVSSKNKALNKLQTDKTGNDTDCEAKKINEVKEQIDALKHHPWRHLIFSHQINEETFKKHLILTYRGLVYAKKCLKGPSDKFIKTKQVLVPDAKYPKNRTLLLDLDETLIHSCNSKEGPDHVVWAKGDFGEESKIGFKVRPYCHEFLQKLSQLWDIYVFTASSPSYASAIINFLDPENKYIIGILNRSNCMETKNGFFIKDLRILKNKNLKSTVIVDNLAHSFGFQIENGIPILEWHNDKNDTELKHLLSYLVECAQVDDVRKFNKDKLKLELLTDAKLEDIQ